MIYHITTRPRWQMAQETGEYTDMSLDKEGFIHCSTDEQVLDVANGLYRALENPVLLVIDEEKVEPAIKYESPAEGGDRAFPHIYGPLNADAIVEVYDMPRDEDGRYQMPEELA